ncbi:MAG TPA: helix-turn-helix transcriptional regulator [Thermoanaerobaculia bacterium]|nr:helix-turn-helix transcriptional regulator [Thermoanaerobaculia bacterium]
MAKVDRTAGLVLGLFRESLDLSQEEFAPALGISQRRLSSYERGEAAVPRDVLERGALRAGFPVFLLDALLRDVRLYRLLARGSSRADRILESGIAVELVALVAGATDVLLDRARPPAGAPPAAEDREAAAALWAMLEGCSSAERRMLVEELEEFWSWALCERVAAESVARAPNRPGDALELAELALLVAERVSGERRWLWRLKGYALLMVANSRRVCQDLPGSDEALARARPLFEAGAPGDPGLLNAAWLPWIESAIRRAQRRFPEAFQLIEEALVLDRGELMGQILLSKSLLHATLGDSDASMAALMEAEPLIDPNRNPRDAFGLRFNLLVDLCNLGEFEQAEARLPEVKALAERIGEELDLTRAVWLEAKVLAGRGRVEEARAAFEQVQEVAKRWGLAYSHALVSQELALLLLEQGETARVREMAETMLATFLALGVEREPLAALRLFWDAAKRETATVDLARRVVKFLHRAQHDPELRFE